MMLAIIGTTPGAPGSYDRTQAMSALLAQTWWVIALHGVFAIVFALINFFWPEVPTLSFALFFSAYMSVDGVFGIVVGGKAASNHWRWALLVLEGVFNILVIVAFQMLAPAVVYWLGLMGVWSLIIGMVMIVAAFKLSPAFGRGWLIFSSIVSVLSGVALLIAPLMAAHVQIWWIGAYALASGIMMIVSAFKLNPAFGRGWLIVSGIVSVWFGVELLIVPRTDGAGGWAYWIGAYALAFGISLLVLAFKLRGCRNDAAAISTSSQSV
ncbi:MAG TPA: DUF308 domain-containing protein [Microvirga sp.]|jgi:uncharacterized membrane protein HdeD (DUF308 family)|nr:DUF308 domain-containing protein [Microvirga sp.]